MGRNRWEGVRDGVAIVAIFTSMVMVALALVIPELGQRWLPWLYLLDLLCWADLVYRALRARQGGYLESMQGSKLALLLATAPWELLFVTTPMIEGALPWLWALRLFRLFQINVLLLRLQLLGLQRSGSIHLFRLLINIALISHLLACSWLLLGYLAEDSSWLAKTELLDAESQRQYIRALYWTITTMTTVGYGDITPAHDVEFLFSAGVMLVGASFYAYVIGNVALLVGQLNASRNQYYQQAQQVSEYLYEQQAPPALIQRIKAYYFHRWRRYNSVSRASWLDDLPHSLAVEVKTFLARRLIEQVPLFQQASEPLREQLLDALELEYVAPQCQVAREGEYNEQLSFILEGSMRVVQGGETLAMFGPGDEYGLHSMTSGERRTAGLVTDSYCELMHLSQTDYDRIQQHYPEIKTLLEQALSDNLAELDRLNQQGARL